MGVSRMELCVGTSPKKGQGGTVLKLYSIPTLDEIRIAGVLVSLNCQLDNSSNSFERNCLQSTGLWTSGGGYLDY